MHPLFDLEERQQDLQNEKVKQNCPGAYNGFVFFSPIKTLNVADSGMCLMGIFKKFRFR